MHFLRELLQLVYPIRLCHSPDGLLANGPVTDCVGHKR